MKLATAVVLIVASIGISAVYTRCSTSGEGAVAQRSGQWFSGPHANDAGAPPDAAEQRAIQRRFIGTPSGVAKPEVASAAR